ncbi:Pumilio-family RNA binding repeat protein [Xylariales sp. AK1849]|nr:Pumilio-family RNA binding repeat protein [Xylariales sp. AK1849]
MAGSALTGSPTIRRTLAPKSIPMEENIKAGKEVTSVADDSERPPPLCLKKSSTALSTASLVNQSFPKLNHGPLNAQSTSMPIPSVSTPAADFLLARLSDQQLALNKNQKDPKTSGDDTSYQTVRDQTSSSNSVPATPATEDFGSTIPTTRSASATGKEGSSTDDEILRLKLELAQAQSTISQLEQIRPPKIEFGYGHTSPLDAEFPGGMPIEHNSSSFPGRGIGMNPPVSMTNSSWSAHDDSKSDTSDALSATSFNRSRNIWNGGKPALFPGASFSGPDTPQNVNAWAGRGSNQGFMDPSMAFHVGPDNYRADRLTPDYDMTIRAPSNRRSGRFDNRYGSPAFNNPGPIPYGGGYNNYGQTQYDGSGPSMSGPGQYPVGMRPYGGHQPSPIGTPLSPLATEFTSGNGPWKTEHVATEGPTYLPTTEPLNYRRLLDRNVNCNWKYIVDKIVCNNDQQASIFLQQKLKVGTPDQKYEIVEAIVLQAHPLMVNRFGNFLVQRCFEHGTPEQVIKIAEAIRGNTLSLSMDPFGCHVVQKAFDSVPEDYKAVMVHELLRRIPETVIHRYACHVWQKLFELRWSESPPQIMKYVNEALRGMWHEVALGETGSLVVQNIFENCLEDDKRPCIEEVLANIDIVAHGQFGNWCIQHVCEHGAPADRSRAIDHVIRFAAEYSTDQYASKVVKKCLKIGGGEFLSRYLDRVCEGRRDRPRIPLIDIASDQYGNYLIQWILTHANPQHRDVVAAHIRKHMVSLRGSKFGSRVGMLCTNPAVATRPGPSVSNLGRVAGPRYGRSYQ